MPVDHLFAAPVLLELDRATALCATSRSSRPMPAAWNERGSTPSASAAELAIIDKRRVEANVAQTMNVIGDVAMSQTCIIIDDLVDTAGTLVKARSSALMEQGSQRR